MRRRVVCGGFTTVLLLATSCDNALGPDTVGSVVVDVDRGILVEGETVAITAEATDTQGSSIPTSEITWISRDPSTVRVENESLTAVAPGVTTVVADVRGARDSVRIRVRFRSLDNEEIAVRIQGQSGVRQSITGRTLLRRELTIDAFDAFTHTQSERTEIFTALSGENVVATDQPFDALHFASDTVVWVAMNSLPTPGARTIQSFQPVENEFGFVLQGTEGAMLRLDDPEDDYRAEIFVPVETVDVEFDEVVFPDEPGLAGGFLRGAVAFEAAGLIVETDRTTFRQRIVDQVADTTISVYAEFQTSLLEWLTGTALVVVNGGDYQNDTTYAGSQALYVDGGAEILLAAVQGEPQSPGDLSNRLLMESRTRIETTESGVLDVQVTTPTSFDASESPPGTWSRIWLKQLPPGGIGEPEQIGTGYSTGGAISLTEYRAPTREAFGLMEGTFAVTIELWENDTAPTGETIQITSDFLIPILPKCTLIFQCPPDPR